MGRVGQNKAMHLLEAEGSDDRGGIIAEVDEPELLEIEPVSPVVLPGPKNGFFTDVEFDQLKNAGAVRANAKSSPSSGSRIGKG